nr:MAG TPA: hypothetical protein [Caudoviricetes sp.]
MSNKGFAILPHFFPLFVLFSKPLLNHKLVKIKALNQKSQKLTLDYC